MGAVKPRVAGDPIGICTSYFVGAVALAEAGSSSGPLGTIALAEAILLDVR